MVSASMKQFLMIDMQFSRCTIPLGFIGGEGACACECSVDRILTENTEMIALPKKIFDLQPSVNP